MPGHYQILDSLPDYEVGQFPARKPDGKVPMWSGDKAPPMIGETVRWYGRGHPHMGVADHYAVIGGWLFAMIKEPNGAMWELSGTDLDTATAKTVASIPLLWFHVAATYATTRGNPGRWSGPIYATDEIQAMNKVRTMLESNRRRRYADKLDMTATRYKEGYTPC